MDVAQIGCTLSYFESHFEPFLFCMNMSKVDVNICKKKKKRRRNKPYMNTIFVVPRNQLRGTTVTNFPFLN